MIIEIDTALERAPSRKDYDRTVEVIVRETVPENNREQPDWSAKTKTTAKEQALATSIPETGAVFAHKNYLDYLVQCYATHRIYVLTPDIIWHAILSEIASEVTKRAELYRPLFTVSEEQTQIIVGTPSDPTDLPLAEVMDHLRRLVPTDVDRFLPEFSTTDDLARFARYAAFAEICSPYYSYATLLCGYQAVDVRGTIEDYDRIGQHSLALIEAFKSIGDTVLSEYLGEKIVPLIARLVTAVEEKDGDFFKDILISERCGSGSQIQVQGWWVRDMYIRDYTKQMPHNTPTHISRVVYTNLDTGRVFSINCGLLYTVDEGDIAVPQWAWVKNEIFETTEIVEYNPYEQIPLKIERVTITATVSKSEDQPVDLADFIK